VRLVFDTNVLVAAVVASGVCRDLVEYCPEHHHLVTSDFILGELREKLDRKFRLSADVVDGVLESFAARMQIVVPVALDPPVCRDPDDDWVLATAVAGKCECVITGDSDLSRPEGIPRNSYPAAACLPRSRVRDRYRVAQSHAETRRRRELAAVSTSLRLCVVLLPFRAARR